MNKKKMLSKDAIAGKEGSCFVTVGTERKLLFQVINVKASLEKIKTEVKSLGRTMTGNKTTGMKGTGSFTLHYNTSLFRELALQYKETGEDVYFDMQITNDDPSSAAGRQTTILYGCNADSMIIAYLDADEEILNDEFDFTFEDFDMPERFAELKGMSQ